MSLNKEKQKAIWRKASRKYRLKNLDKIREKNKGYDFKTSSKKYSQKNREKINAKANANYHIQIPKGKICEFNKCNNLATDKHHKDYNKPKEVEFLCKLHHGFT